MDYLSRQSVIHASFFTYKAAPYSGKPDGDGPYYICATEDYVK